MSFNPSYAVNESIRLIEITSESNKERKMRK
jgi:hypothetical protein